MVWAAITYEGPAALYYIDEKVNSQVYRKILEDCLPDIEGLSGWFSDILVRWSQTSHSSINHGLS